MTAKLQNGTKWAAIPVALVIAFAGGFYTQGLRQAAATEQIASNKERLGQHVTVCDEQFVRIQTTLEELIRGLSRIEGRLGNK